MESAKEPATVSASADVEMMMLGRQDDILDHEEDDEDEERFEELGIWTSRFNCLCSAFCTALGSCIRFLFASSILALCLFIFIIIIQAAWGVFLPAERHSTKPLSPSQRYSRNDDVAMSFPLCANKKRTMHPFIRNICWKPSIITGEVDQFAILISRSLMDLAISEVGRKRLFLVDASFRIGGTLNGQQHTMRNMPASDSEYNVFRFDASPNQAQFCDVRRESYWLEEEIEEGVLQTLPILRLEDDEVWLDATRLVRSLFYIVKSPAAKLRDTQQQAVFADSIRISSVSVFPRNVIVSLDVTTRNLMDSTAAPLVQSIDFSLTLLTETPEKAREAHEAVGYFTTSIRLDKARGGVLGGGKRLRMITRRSNMVFYIDPSVPMEYRGAVKHGVEMWNLALKPVQRQVRVVFPTDLDWPRDYSVADVRYSTISWSVALDRVFAIGPSTVDPRSGEILNSDIVLADKWPVAWSKQLEFFSSSTQQQQPTGRCIKQALRGSTLAMVNATELSREFILAGIADVVAHEIGHALGLRHNFKGSLQIPHDKLGNERYVREFGMTTSVMDYLDLNPHFLNTALAFPQAIGTYDIAAIRYGYEESLVGMDNVIVTTFGTTVELASNPTLQTIASSVGEYGTDEDHLDPEAAVFDMSNDPLMFCETSMESVRVLRAGLFRNHDLARIDLAQRVLSSQLVHLAKLATGYVGGKVVSNRAGGADKLRSDFVPHDKQLRALKMVLKLCTSHQEYFPHASWFKICEVAAVGDDICLYEGQLVEVDWKLHALPLKRNILRTLLGDVKKLQRLDEGGSPLQLGKFLDQVVQAFFDPVHDSKLWDLQVEYITVCLELLATKKPEVLPQYIRAQLRVSLDHVLTAYRTRPFSSPDFVAHAALCVELITQSLAKLGESNVPLR